jgi:hypothetical protein
LSVLIAQLLHHNPPPPPPWWLEALTQVVSQLTLAGRMEGPVGGRIGRLKERLAALPAVQRQQQFGGGFASARERERRLNANAGQCPASFVPARIGRRMRRCRRQEPRKAARARSAVRDADFGTANDDGAIRVILVVGGVVLELGLELVEQTVQFLGGDVAPQADPACPQLGLAQHRFDVEHEAGGSAQRESDTSTQDFLIGCQ